MSLHIIALAIDCYYDCYTGFWIYDTDNGSKQIYSGRTVEKLIESGVKVYNADWDDVYKRIKVVGAYKKFPRVYENGMRQQGYYNGYKNLVLINLMVDKNGEIKWGLLSDGIHCDIKMEYRDILTIASVNNIANAKVIRRNNKYHISAIKGSIERIKI